MTKSNYIKLTKPFIENFLSPLSNVVDKAPFLIKDSKISTCCKNPSGEVSVNFSMDIETDVDDVTINVPDMVKFKNLLERGTVLADSDRLNIHKNKLSYKSTKWRFNYHLLDSGLMKNMNLKPDIISNFDSSLTFNLKSDVLSDIVKLKTFHKNKVEKVYIKLIDDAIYACLTDETIMNTDELSVFVTDRYNLYDEDKLSNMIIKYDVIKILSQHRGVPFKIKCSEGAFLIQTIWNGVTITYITAKLLK